MTRKNILFTSLFLKAPTKSNEANKTEQNCLSTSITPTEEKQLESKTQELIKQQEKFKTSKNFSMTFQNLNPQENKEALPILPTPQKRHKHKKNYKTQKTH